MSEPVCSPRPDEIVLDPIEQRVIGALLEKQRTVPASYPLSLSSLRTACNQTSSRDPITDYDDRCVTDAIQRLKTRRLARVVWAGGSSRVLRYHQLLDEVLSLQPDERALITVLLLRGPQSPGELRTRTDRLHAFGDKEAVEARLRAMAELSNPLVRELGRRAGQHERRWVHLLGPVPVPDGPAAEPEVDRDQVLVDGAATRDAKVVAGYDAVAQAYADDLVAELDHKPFDRWLLDRIAAEPGALADLGCGPGHVTARLAAHRPEGSETVGYDLSPAMVEQARHRFPGITFEVGDLTRLLRPRTAAGWSAITAWYALVHLAGSELPTAIAGLARVLLPGGWLAVSVHVGDEVRHVEDMWGAPVDLDFVFHDQDQILAAFAGAGLVDVEWYLRGPYPGHEVETRRLYVLGRATGRAAIPG